mmetsp:Transcript_23138/g.48036  ORF Transcript_23138/g.48036 Transcript_23138/m.48036 type:complete len:1065 (-) Transcript_23138:305-3499(-)
MLATKQPPKPSRHPLQYTVLYYKRTNKVHKNRGTSRIDGILTFNPPPSCVASLKSEGNERDNNDFGNGFDLDDENDDICCGGDGSKKYESKEKLSKKQKFQYRKKSVATGALKMKSGVIWSGVNNSLSHKAFSAEGIGENEELVLNAQWECEVVGLLNDSASTSFGREVGSTNGGIGRAISGAVSAGKRGVGESSLMLKPAVGLSSLKTSGRLGPGSRTIKRTPLVPLNNKLRITNKNNSNSNPSALSQSTGTKKRPLPSSSSCTARRGAASASSSAPVSLMKRDKNGEWHLEKSSLSDDDEDRNCRDEDSPIFTSKIPRSLVRKNNGGVKNARLVVARLENATYTTKRGNSSNATNTKCDNINSNSNISNNSSINEEFPGALGDKLNVPASIRQVLRPHQREGIAFLWNCVTGVSPGLRKAYATSLELTGAVSGSCDDSLGSFDTWEEEEEEDEYLDLSESDCDCSGDQFEKKIAANKGVREKLLEVDKALPRGAVLADEMGLGKTLMTIATIFALYRRKRDHRFIVVCPSSLVSNWAIEFDKWLGKASQPKRVTVRNGNEEGLRNLRSFVPLKPNQSEVLILSYELFRLHVKIIAKATKIGCLVVDEGHRLKNTSGSQTLSALNSMEAEARILITGTPIQNNLSEFYNVANFALPGILGDLNSFRKLYERPMSQANQKNASRSQKDKGQKQSRNLDAITSTFVLRRLQKDVLKSLLPPRMELLLFCRPTELQCEIYRDVSNRASTSVSSIGGFTDRNNPLLLLTEVRKLCTHPALLNKVDLESDLSLSSQNCSLSGKLIILESLLKSIRYNSPTDKVVIISNFTSALTVIEEAILRKQNMPFVRLDGSLALADRQPIVDSFNNRSVDHSFAFLLSSKAGGCGLNLIGANRLIMVDADWNPATDQQAMARVYRQGQKKPCFIYRMFTTGTVEEVIFQRQTQKGNLANLANYGGSKGKSKSNSASFTQEELRECFTLKEGVKCDTKRKLGKKWGDYEGATSLESIGCTDRAILDVCQYHTDTLSYVRVVETEQKSNTSSTEDESESVAVLSGNDESSTEEEEFG